MGVNTKSMTGYAKSRALLQEKSIVVEIKSVNSKQLDVNVRVPQSLREKEMELRAMISDAAERGKIDVLIYFEGEVAEKRIVLNKKLASNYYHEAQALASELNDKSTDILSVVLALPDIYRQEITATDDKEWIEIKKLIAGTLVEFNQFRTTEGTTLGNEIKGRINNILHLLSEVEQLDGKRIELIKNRIGKGLEEIIPVVKIDQNRFEQELIYYIEKLDITEEKVRLKTHGNYFLEVMMENANGRKLNFISQEIGREINTIGSKANDASIQKIVVVMKDELEKIKEQLLNIL